MPVEHIVLFKTSRSFTADEIAEIRTRLLKIPGVLSVSVGMNYTKRALEYAAGVVVRLTTKEAEVAYQTHPQHIYVRDNLLKPVMITGTDSNPPVLAMDYQFHESVSIFNWQVLAGFVCGAAVGCLAMAMRHR